jgi:beta-lactam-binding protein with PASTA domain
VALTISLGQTTVPSVLGLDESSAVRAITAGGLAVGRISTINNCLDRGLVQLQNPGGGALVTPGTSVSITIATCNSGNGDGPPLHPK